MTGLSITEQQLHKRTTGIRLPGILFCIFFAVGMVRILLSGSGENIRLWLTGAGICLAVICLTGILVNSRWKEWSFLIIAAVLLLVILVHLSSIKNGIGICANEWLEFMTGKTGKIYLDYAVHGKNDGYLVLFLGLSGLSALLAWDMAHQRIWIGTGILILATAGITTGFFAGDTAAIVGMMAGYVGMLLYRRASDGAGWKAQMLTLPGCIVVLLISVGVSFAGGSLAEQKISAEKVRLALTSGIHEKRYDQGDSVLSDGNLVNLGKFKKSKKTALKITMEKPEKMYLRGMTADTYTGSSWEPLSAKAYQKGEDLFYWLHKSGFYGQCMLSQAEELSGKDQKALSLKIQNVAACKKYQYLPYALTGTDGLNADGIGDDRNVADGTGQKLKYYTGSIPQWYQTGVWLAANQKEKKVSDYLAKEESYRKYVYKYDLQITGTAAGVCEQLLGEQKSPEERSLSEILQTIRDTLDDRLEYRTGTVTYNGSNDFFKYTMEQSKSGYSVQYATAATLMLRYLGVPARYVEGYYLSPQEAEKYQSGDKIRITRAQAHAWAEYYLDGVGWIPFEVTPGYIDEEEDQKVTKILAEGQGDGEGQALQESPLTYTPPSYQKESETAPDQTPQFRFRTRYIIPVILIVTAVLILTGVLWIAYRHRKLRQFLKELENSDERTAITGLYGYSQMLKNRYGLDLEENTDEIDHINAEARFSRHEMGEEKLRKMKQYTDKVIQTVRQEKGFWRKFRDHYLLWLYR